MNLRGAVVPVVDLRLALGLADPEYGKFTVIIVLAVRGKTVGFVVDSVSDVLSSDSLTVEPTPELAGRVDVSLVKSIARTGDRFVMVLDIDRLSGIDLPDVEAA